MEIHGITGIALFIGVSAIGAFAIWGFVSLMRLIPAGKGSAIDRFGDKPPPDKFDPSDFLQQHDGGRVGAKRDDT